MLLGRVVCCVIMNVAVSQKLSIRDNSGFLLTNYVIDETAACGDWPKRFLMREISATNSRVITK